MSALPKSRLPKEFKIISGKPRSRHAPLGRAVKADAVEVIPDRRSDTHQRFVDAVHAGFGMWKGRDDIPHDGLEYERWVRGKCP
ncbi:MAG: hypothetical protein V4693_10885 [Pseudomonadota bacterium]